ncbi:MAG: hypothetical protein PVSMB5_04620 [Ktedonobacteraceae bacterium]
MERVLIVAKTYMQSGVCIGGLTRETNRSVRLLAADGSHQSADTSLDVRQVWDMDFHPPASLTPPHVEDVCVTHEEFIGTQKDMRALLLPRIKIWEGGPEKLFDGRIVFGDGVAYVNRDKELPTCSTGYWLSDRLLTLIYRSGSRPYYWLNLSTPTNPALKKLYIRYVGFAVPLVRIPPQTLIRVSLARWWVPSNADDERCFLQISGWYK